MSTCCSRTLLLVAASTQNHALNALVFLFRDAVKKGIGEFVLLASLFSLEDEHERVSRY